MSAATTARRLRPDWEITVLERGSHVSFILCGLPYFICNVIKDLESLIVYTPEYFRKERDIDVRTRHEVRRIDVQAQEVEALGLDMREKETIHYDSLVIAAGADAVRPNIPGISLTGVFTLRSLQSGSEIKQFLKTRRVRRVALIGGGYIGLEMAEAMRTAGARAAIVEATDSLMPGSEPEIAKLIEEEVRRHQVEVRKQQLALRFEPDASGAVQRVVTDQGEVPAEMVVVAVGASPDASVAREAGIALGETRAIAVDERMCTNIPNVYAAGDCVETRHLITGKATYLPLGTTANKQGRVAGENAVGGSATFAGVVGSSAVKVFDLEVARTGLSEEQAKAHGFDAVSATGQFPSRARFYPGAETVTGKLVAERGSGRLLGAQMAGKDGGTVAKRLDVAATALHAGMTVSDILRLDLNYAPPFAAAFEGIQAVAQALQRRLEEAD
jgi:NADPH-dependent 2,4-dienoyl-CoA reductase/sulfur reductase-like enzyme